MIFTGFEHIFDQGSTAEATSGSSQVDTNMVELVSSLVAKLIHQGFLSNMKWFDENGNEKMKAGKKKQVLSKARNLILTRIDLDQNISQVFFFFFVLGLGNTIEGLEDEAFDH